MKKYFPKIIATAAGLLLPLTTLAVSYYNPSASLELGTADLQSTVVNIIKWVLGLLGLVAVIMIIIGGFKWMTAAGNEEKIESAKKLLYAAVVGLIIVLLAWAIVSFAIGTLEKTSGAS